MGTFLQKYYEHQFSMTTKSAGLMVGMLIVPSGGLATILSGFFLKKFNKSRNSAIGQCIIANLLALPFILSFTLSCPNIQYRNFEKYNSSCNSDCSCSVSTFDPVCGSDGFLYKSPCEAGCQESLQFGNFTNCLCIQDEASFAIKGICQADCDYFVPFSVGAFFLIFLTFWISMPATMATLRCVEEKERSLAIGLQNIVGRLLGSLPGPILFGYFIDKTCILKQESCGK